MLHLLAHVLLIHYLLCSHNCLCLLRYLATVILQIALVYVLVYLKINYVV